MTPQLQQAIALLQMSSQELESKLIEALESNPLLDTQEPEFSLDESPDNARSAEPTPESEESPVPEASFGDESSRIDENWSTEFMSAKSPRSNSSSQSDFNESGFELADNQDNDLIDHLLWQLNLSHCSACDLSIGIAIIDAINEDGYLTESIEQIHQTVLTEHEVEEDEVVAMLHRIQHFDPVGVGAMDLRDCLNIQLNLIDSSSPAYDSAKKIINEGLELLAQQQISKLKSRLAIDENELKLAIAMIRSLEPKPGSKISTKQTEYVRPDVLIEKIQGIWRARLHDEFTPKLSINNYYADMIKTTSKSDASYLRNQLQEARWLLKSVETRNDTVLKVATAIVARQYDFFEHGPGAMQPLVLREIAEMIDMHESTVSRVTNGKYMLTPRGVFEFKYFFSSQVGTSDGEGASATAIQTMIRQLIEEESPKKPLSDSKLATLLNQKGIDVARRTVAKYREAINIASSSKRKRLI